MKKIKSLLSIALVLAMALSLLPTVFASETADDTVSVTYDFKGVGGKYYYDKTKPLTDEDGNIIYKDDGQTPKGYEELLGPTLSNYTYEYTTDKWEGGFVYDAFGKTGVSASHLNSSAGLFMRNLNSWAVVKINIPASGNYNSINFKYKRDDNTTTKIDMYYAGVKTQFSDDTDLAQLEVVVDDLNLYKAVSANNNSVEVSVKINKFLAVGEHYLVFCLRGGKGTDEDSTTPQAQIHSITLSGVKATAPTATFSAVTNVDGNDVKVKVDGIANENKIISAPRGSAISATAPEIPGYKFVGWKRGSNNENDDYKSYISDKNPLEMSLLTNTFVTACYVTESYENEAMVEYYNQNGDYIETKSADEAAPTPDAITGFTFEAGNWFIRDDTLLDLSKVNSLTRAVARHTPNANAGTATVNGTPVSDKTAFDSAITPVATEGFTAWKRDGKVVSYNQEYTYYLWDTTEIEESTEAITDSAKSGDKKLPLIVLESGNGGAYMIEYDAADFEIVEVGILFSTAGEPTVDSCTAKYTSQRNSAHGQFTAKASGTAKGYLIYEDGDAYKVIYATAE
ncbi:MAG: hypothetical protein E7441_08480 [Ruminococcaceae bacterium]|nr:hypothetical protein [Oscillospiraceae bacterium]